jgi:hypothetical protein
MLIQDTNRYIRGRRTYYKMMPFGLNNAGATYQQTMQVTFLDQIGRNIEIYIDELIVKSKE